MFVGLPKRNLNAERSFRRPRARARRSSPRRPKDRYMVNAINRYLMTSVTCNLSALVVCIGIYIVMDSIDETWDMAIMWRWTRAPVILVCMLVIWGSGDTVSAFKYRHFALIPNQFVEEKGSCSHTEWDPAFGTTKFPDARLFRDSWGNFENFYISMCFFAIFFSSICVSYGTFAATRDTKTMPEPSRKIVARQRTASGPRRDSGTADAPAGGNWFTARFGRARFGETVCL
jgi:hypothetical protein